MPVLEVGDGYIVMPLYRGRLADAIDSAPSGRLSLDETVDLAAQLGQGLDALHACAIVHRDVKPSNVLLDGDGVAALADFGLARGADSTQLTRDGQLVGTLHYLAPELIEGEEATPRERHLRTRLRAVRVPRRRAARSPAERRPSSASRTSSSLRPTRASGARSCRPTSRSALLTALEKDPSRRPTSGTALAGCSTLHAALRLP